MIQLSGQTYRAESPSLLHLVDPACRAEAHRRLVTLRFIGRPCRAEASGEGGWVIAIRGVYGTREFSSRDEAAALIAQAFETAASAYAQ